MQDFSIYRVDFNRLPSKLLNSWADLYCEIWKEAPWNEDFWTRIDVITDFTKEMKYPHAEAYLAITGEKVVGFTHGYSVSKEDLRVISGNALLDDIFNTIPHAYYIDELGVHKEFRGQGVAKKLSHALIRAASRYNSLTQIVLRTDLQATAARTLYQALNFEELNAFDVAYPDRTYWLLKI